ncbi:hypothetical protein NG895_03560 [Aeoliella sp. ICT_H6.2]|uniref:Secreted protein n=1 Tax=Aeoliella straminimaris TaxID=2954799 RepID=A0A9X2FF73_9BACT|nr:hypothetical protein [Aeoliella straminimaris]MCO6042976.1 hypothetical protein [Aeoliella straminimaris]
MKCISTRFVFPTLMGLVLACPLLTGCMSEKPSAQIPEDAQPLGEPVDDSTTSQAPAGFQTK